MQLFYSNSIHKNTIELSEEESKHCVQVLRKRSGDEIWVTDGKGFMYKTTLIEPNRKACLLHIDEIQEQDLARKYSVHICIAPPKNPKRFEWLVEKLTEIGVQRITPMICDRSDRIRINNDRLTKRMIAAMKQSLQTRIPILDEPIKYKEFLPEISSSQKAIAWVSPKHKTTFSNYLDIGKDVCLLIGPEGDFTNEEIEFALSIGFDPVSLGPTRLRTETAGFVGALTIHAINKSI